MNLPRLVATDLDGTLVGRDYVISRRSARALADVQAAGIAVVLVTGRPVRWLGTTYDQLAEAYPTICANGAVDYDPATDRVHRARSLAPSVLAEVCTRLVAALPGIAFAAEIDSGRRMVHEPAYPVWWEPAASGASEAPLSELVMRPAVKLLARSDAKNADQLAELIETVVEGRVEVTHSSSIGLVEMSAIGVTKGTGLAAHSERLGIKADDVLAFGDMPNDVPMLRWAGCGVAVANAHPATQAAADDHTLSNVDDGVAVYLERLLG